MEKEFVPYELAAKLKELGFDEPCFGRYNVPGEFILSGCYSDSPLVHILVEQNDICEAHTLAPTFSQAFRWFRDKHNIVGEMNSYYLDKEWSFNYDLVTIFKEKASDRFDTYEEARLACLTKLIEIVETKIKK